VDPQTGKPNGVMGVPANYKPAATPLIVWGAADLPANAPAGTNVATYWDTNNVWVRLKDGSVTRVLYDNNLNPWRNQFVMGPITWNLSASLYKAVRINERFTLRVNADCFNVLNVPGLTMPDSQTGILSKQLSQNEARNLQMTMRLQW
jgi:hypothetical protein